jgi:hypothetical protein
MGVPPWTAADEGYLRAYQWAGALAGGAQPPVEATAVQVGPGEVAHANLAAVNVTGYFGEDTQYRRSFFLIGGPVGLAVTGAASLAHNASKKREAERAARPSWHMLGNADIVVTNQRLVATANGRVESFWYAEAGPMQLVPGTAGVPAVQFQSAGHPLLQLQSVWIPLVFVFVHYHVDGQAPAVPMPVGLLERAQSQGRLG